MAKKRVVKVRFYVFTALIGIAVCVALFLLFSPATYEVVENGSLTYEKEAEVVLVREERIVSQDNYGRITFDKLEGEQVDSGAKVATIYAWGYSEKVVQDLLEVQRQIEDYQENTILAQVFENDLKAIYTQIDEKVQTVSEVVQGRRNADLVSIERDIKSLMQQRNDYLKRTATPDEELNKLFDKETELLERIAAWKQDVVVDAAGIVSFFIDGFEDKLKPEKIDTLSDEDIKAVMSNYYTMQKQANDASSQPLYRLVTGVRWYCLMATPEDKNLIVDSVYNMSFSGHADTPYSGRLVSVRETGSESLYTIEIEAPLGPLLSLRRADTKLSTTYEGLKISQQALHEQGDTVGVWLARKEGDVFTPVNIVFQNEGYAIVRPVDEGALGEGMSVRH